MPAGVLVKLAFTEGAPAGTHAVHLHETGRCEPPDFTSAGGHFNPTKASHGFLDAEGPHAGDLPNVHLPANGMLTVEFVASHATLRPSPTSLLDPDGAAVVVHEGADDYRTDPAGSAASRVACGVVQR
jgi:Cu-Zn family superoxide dismutase